MFDPTKAKKDKEEKAARRKALSNVKGWAMNAIPMELQAGLIMDVKEVICGDPNCAPIDTVITLVWKDGGRGMFGFPLDPLDVQPDDVIEMFPTPEVLGAWSRGEEAEWPPRPQLRFQVDDRVACRVGPHPVTGWAPGRVVKLFYREESKFRRVVSCYFVLPFHCIVFNSISWCCFVFSCTLFRLAAKHDGSVPGHVARRAFDFCTTGH